MRIAWRTVGSIITRVWADVEAQHDRLAGLRRIGIDDISYKKGHKYLMVVVDRDTRRLVWAAPGRNSTTVWELFDLLGAERCSQITHVSADGADFIDTIVAQSCPNAVRVADPSYAEVLVMPISVGNRWLDGVPRWEVGIIRAVSRRWSRLMHSTPDPSHVAFAGPLRPFASGFAAELTELGYTATSATVQLQLAAQLSRWLGSEHLGPEELSGPVIGRFLAVRRASYANLYSLRALGPASGICVVRV